VEFLERQQYSNSILVQDKEAKISELEYSLQMIKQDNDRLQQEILNLKVLIGELRGKNQKLQQDFESSQREVTLVQQKLVKIETKYENIEEIKEKQVG
jgi:chromosome segregation ATPase